MGEITDKDLEIYRCMGPNCKGGSEAIVCLVRGAKSRRYLYHVECYECGARGPGGLTKVEAISNWNKFVEIGSREL